MALCPKCSWPLVGPEGEMPRCANMNCGYVPPPYTGERFEVQRVGTPEAEITVGPELIDAVEIRNNGTLIAHCDKDNVWWLHVSGEELPLRMLTEMMVLLEETLHKVSETMKGMAADARKTDG